MIKFESLFTKEWHYRVLRNIETDEHLLCVVLGPSLAHEVALKLNDDEKKEFYENRESLEHLVEPIRTSREDLRDRLIRDFKE